MNVSDWVYDGTPNYPVEVHQLEDGKYKVTSNMLKGREWVAETSEQAMRAFRDDTQKDYAKMILGDEPEWMKEERARRVASGRED